MPVQKTGNERKEGKKDAKRQVWNKKAREVVLTSFENECQAKNSREEYYQHRLKGYKPKSYNDYTLNCHLETSQILVHKFKGAIRSNFLFQNTSFNPSSNLCCKY